MRHALAVALLTAVAGAPLLWLLPAEAHLRIEDLAQIVRIEPTLPGAPNLIAVTELLPPRVMQVCSLRPYAAPALHPEHPGLAGIGLDPVPEGEGLFVYLGEGGVYLGHDAVPRGGAMVWTPAPAGTICLPSGGAAFAISRGDRAAGVAIGLVPR